MHKYGYVTGHFTYKQLHLDLSPELSFVDLLFWGYVYKVLASICSWSILRSGKLFKIWLHGRMLNVAQKVKLYPHLCLREQCDF